MPPTAAGARAAFADRVAAAAGALASATTPPGVEEFARLCVADLSQEDLDERGETLLANAALDHWTFAGQRPPSTALVRVHSPTVGPTPASAHTVVEVVTDDMPFIVDSVTMEIARHGIGIHLVTHPIVGVTRDPNGRLLGLSGGEPGPHDGVTVESFVRIEIDRENAPEPLAALARDLQRILSDVRSATDDWQKMIGVLLRVADRLDEHPPPIDTADLSEGRALLAWIGDQHFTFVGYREYALETVDGEDLLRPVAGTGLGILRDREDAPRPTSFAQLSREGRRKAREPQLLVLTKANSRSTVHRPAYLDYVGIKRFAEDGQVVGEYRFLGLYTLAAYTSTPLDIPLLRHKVKAVLERAGFVEGSHSHKDLMAVLETYPRDELFQMSADELFEAAMGIMELQDRRRVRLFARRDSWGRFVSCLVYVPRDRYTTELQMRIARILEEAFGAIGHELDESVTQSVLARLHYVLHIDPGSDAQVDLREVESRIAAAVRSWADGLREALVAACGEEAGLTLANRYAEAFPAAYRDDVSPEDAVVDIADVERLLSFPQVVPCVRLSSTPPGGESTLDLRIIGSGLPLSLSDVMPLLQNLGVSVVDEHPYLVEMGTAPTIWIERFDLNSDVAGAEATAEVRDRFEAAFLAMIRGEAENDGLQRLVLAAGLDWRQIAVLRAYSRYMRQVGTSFSQPYIADALVERPDIARLLVDIFEARFDPTRQSTAEHEGSRLVESAEVALDAVASLDHDRILRNLLALVLATTRTTFFQPPATPLSHLAFKLDPAKAPDLPLPRPKFEIFVYSPRVEGVHLRSGRVARGGIRWSDRREDFRTEILGLMKAQTVKNAVIVPVGAKGGFVVKQPPAEAGALAEEIASCYRTFISGLLDLTDNLVDGATVPPPGIVRCDPDDPYLVVAADKGTATFSDMANEIAVARGYWLGDAFASGGSSGYDHKKMAITARGAWESVQCHFRRLGIDATTTDFTVVGIGDMSGDVFGNGMLRSRCICLVAAFDHRHIFLDPNPDPSASFAERERLFALERSSWADYDRTLISEGGGVFARTAKSVPLSEQVRARLATDAESLTPAELIRAILLAPVDLLWNGGIGTYVKASTEQQTDAADKANDSVRVDARSLRCRAVAEGGNLGLTQRARVEFAMAGGMVNTDAIDNSAGVDCSDHEVNIKILLASAVAGGALARSDRDPLLAEMTDEVAALVLRDNYRQNRALLNALAQAAEMEDVHGRYMRALEEQGRLDRRLEALPDDEALAERHRAGLGLTAPELAVLVAYSKIGFEAEILASDLPDDPDFDQALIGYFPTPLQERFADRIRAHPLRREIVATSIANEIVNRAGISFVFRLEQETGASAPDIARAWSVAWRVLDQRDLWNAIEALDGKVAAACQTRMYLESRKLVERATRWVLRRRRRPLPVALTVDLFGEGVARVATLIPELLLDNERSWLDSCTEELTALGVPDAIARRVAGLESLLTGFDIVEIAAWSTRDVEEVAAVYYLAGERLQIDWLRDRIVELPRADRWQALARIALREDAYIEHRAIAADVLTCSPPGARAEDAFEIWTGRNAASVARAAKVLAEVRSLGTFDISTLSVALREIRNLVQTEG